MRPRHTLLQVPTGKTVRVRALHAEGPLRMRLFSMGITPGTPVEICPGCGCTGARRIRVRDASLVLGESLAECVECEAPLENECGCSSAS